MAQTEDFVTDTTDLDGGDHGRSSKEIRSEIDRTRSDMDETFAALDAKMTPKEIGLELWSLFKGGSSTGAGKLWKVAREHPMPAAVVGLGLGWLLVDTSRKSDGHDGRDRGGYRGYGSGSSRQGYAGPRDDFESGESSGVLAAAKDKLVDVADSTKEAFSSATDRVSDAADWTREHASDLGHQVSDKASALSHQARDRASALGSQAKRQANRARLGFWQIMEENPLMVGAATLAVGVIAGLLLPSTDKEDALMGETRDHLLDEAKEAGQQALDKGKHVAEAMVDKVKEEAQHQGLTAEGLAGKVKTVAQEVTNTAKEEAKRQNLTPEAAMSALMPEQPAQSGQQSQPKPQQATQSQQPKPAQGQQQAKPMQGAKATASEAGAGR
jgi:ElaB/YqjD/DUF883 family membrane-anchored ribosome-binding protein